MKTAESRGFAGVVVFRGKMGVTHKIMRNSMGMVPGGQ